MNAAIVDFYLNNLSILDVFSDYFINEMSDIIDHQSLGNLTQIKNPLLEGASREGALAQNISKLCC